MRVTYARSPWLRGWGVVCLLIITGALSFWGAARRTRPALATEVAPRAEREVDVARAAPPDARATPTPEPAWRAATAPYTARGRAAVRVVPPEAPGEGEPPVLTMLHGMGSSPSRTCARVERASRDGFAVVCPTGNVHLGPDRADWAGEGEEKAAHVGAALSAALSPLDLRPSAARGDVLVGFSRGAFVARDVAYARPGEFRGLVLIGAALVPDAERLRASGVERVVLASGDFDGARSTMLLARAKLCAAGLPARFVSLGPVWHDLPADSLDRLRADLAWVQGRGDAETPGCTRAGS